VCPNTALHPYLSPYVQANFNIDGMRSTGTVKLVNSSDVEEGVCTGALCSAIIAALLMLFSAAFCADGA
jgi:hypothetical protein